MKDFVLIERHVGLDVLLQHNSIDIIKSALYHFCVQLKELHQNGMLLQFKPRYCVKLDGGYKTCCMVGLLLNQEEHDFIQKECLDAHPISHVHVLADSLYGHPNPKLTKDCKSLCLVLQLIQYESDSICHSIKNKHNSNTDVYSTDNYNRLLNQLSTNMKHAVCAYGLIDDNDDSFAKICEVGELTGV